VRLAYDDIGSLTYHVGKPEEVQLVAPISFAGLGRGKLRNIIGPGEEMMFPAGERIATYWPHG